MKELTRRGHEVEAVDLPLTSLDDDADTVRRAVEQVDGPVILVGHSYGGSVITKAAGGRGDIEHLVYVAAVMLDGDDVFASRTSDFPPAPLSDRVEVTEDGQMVVGPDAAVACFYNECEPGQAREAADRMRPTALMCLSVAAGVEPWTTVPSTYVLCERDRAIHPEMQRWMSSRAGRVIVFDTDHSPFMSAPEAFVDLLDDLARPERGSS